VRIAKFAQMVRLTRMPPAGPEFKAVVRERRDAPTVPAAAHRGQASVPRSQRDFPEACRGRLDEGAASLPPLSVPPRHPQSVRTANLAGRAFAEERRRTQGIPHWWDEGRVVNLVFAVLIRVSARWGKKGFSPFEPHQIRALGRHRQLDEPPVVAAPPPRNPGEALRLLPDLFTGTRGLDLATGAPVILDGGWTGS
jgi:hypothetical protein